VRGIPPNGGIVGGHHAERGYGFHSSLTLNLTEVALTAALAESGAVRRRRGPRGRVCSSVLPRLPYRCLPVTKVIACPLMNGSPPRCFAMSEG
jgi:hypothetical protein